MARLAKNSSVDSRSARARLSERREPYWTVVSAGCAIGYRRAAKGGRWLVRFRDDTGRQHHGALGAADDSRDPDNLTVFSFAQAQDKARVFFATKARAQAAGDEDNEGPQTVAEALDSYLHHRERRGSKGVKADRHAANARIRPHLGDVLVSKLTARRIREWQDAIASAPKMVRTRKGASAPATKAFASDDEDAVRARRATANRVLTILKAALNHAYRERPGLSDEGWRKVKPFAGVDAAIIRYLRADECIRLVHACEPAFRELVRGALVTGCRYGELVRMKVSEFNAESGTVSVRLSKSGKPRHVALAEEGLAIFRALAVGRTNEDLIFRRADGGPWKASQQQRPLESASNIARLTPPATFHILRHTYASALAMKGVPMGVIAAQLGHADTRITERHYAHLAPNYVAETVRRALTHIGIAEQESSNVTAIHALMR